MMGEDASAMETSSGEEFVLRSGVRSGFKREFAFALKAQAEIGGSPFGRTRSGKIRRSSTPFEEFDFESAGARKTKRSGGKVKRDGAKDDSLLVPVVTTMVEEEPAMEIGDAVISGDEKKDVHVEELPALEINGVSNGEEDIKMEERVETLSMPTDLEALKVERANVGVDEMKVDVQVDTVEPQAELRSAPEELALRVELSSDVASTTDCIGLEEERSANANMGSGETEIDTVKHIEMVKLQSDLESVREELKPDDDLMPKVVSTNGCNEVEGVNVANANVYVEVTDTLNESSVAEAPIVTEQHGEQRTVHTLHEQSSASTTLIKTEEFPKEAKPVRRFTRSLLKAEEPSLPVELSSTVTSSSSSEESEGVRGGELNNGTSGPLRTTTPKKKMEMKMSKKIALTKLPSNVRELLSTGLLDGLSVTYKTSSKKKVIALLGIIKDGGILCSCSSCNGTKIVSAYQFELHAGSTKKHPSDYIFLENGKSIHDVIRTCTSAPLDMLESTIQSAIESEISTDISFCQQCSQSFQPSRFGKLSTICDSCLVERLTPVHRNPSSIPHTNKRLSKSSLAPNSSESSSKNMSQKKIGQGRVTTKDLWLHKLVFMNDTLPDGTEVAYYARGQRLLEGYIKGSGIFCSCCNSVVSPSQFEAHAGWAKRRKPYLNIYTSNGVSLHELSVSLSKDKKFSGRENDDLCRFCSDGGDLILCDLCPRAFHKECVGVSSIPKGDWYCPCCEAMHQRENYVAHNENAIAAGRVSGVDPIEQIFKRCIRIVQTPESDASSCVLCRCHDFSKSGFGPRTVLLCDQCEKEFHIGCLKDHKIADLEELPIGKWFCCTDCSETHNFLQKFLLSGSQELQPLILENIKRKRKEKGLSNETDLDVKWRLLSGKMASSDCRLLLSKVISIFYETFDPIIDFSTGQDLIPAMVHGRDIRDQDFGGMYCAILTVNSSVVSAGILRVLGRDAAELPLVATTMESQGHGYFQSLFSCIEALLESLNVKHLVLPATKEAEAIWVKKFGFREITSDQLEEYTRGSRTMSFQGTPMLHKSLSDSQKTSEEDPN